MNSKLKNILKTKYYDYFILVSRFLIGFTFCRYGYSKLIDGQFGITPEELTTPLKELSLFRVSWYLFNHEPFSSFIGISQLICGILLIINRTAIIGAFLFLPIVATILIIDITFMPPALAQGFSIRLTFYIILDLLILLHYKEKMLIIWRTISENVRPKFKHKIWLYLLLPAFAIVLELIPFSLRIIKYLIHNIIG